MLGLHLCGVAVANTMATTMSASSWRERADTTRSLFRTASCPPTFPHMPTTTAGALTNRRHKQLMMNSWELSKSLVAFIWTAVGDCGQICSLGVGYKSCVWNQMLTPCTLTIEYYALIIIMRKNECCSNEKKKSLTFKKPNLPTFFSVISHIVNSDVDRLLQNINSGQCFHSWRRSFRFDDDWNSLFLENIAINTLLKNPMHLSPEAEVSGLREWIWKSLLCE